jgi:hypothetical protein
MSGSLLCGTFHPWAATVVKSPGQPGQIHVLLNGLIRSAPTATARAGRGRRGTSARPDAAAGYRPRPNKLIMSYSAKFSHSERRQI